MLLNNTMHLCYAQVCYRDQITKTKFWVLYRIIIIDNCKHSYKIDLIYNSRVHPNFETNLKCHLEVHPMLLHLDKQKIILTSLS